MQIASPKFLSKAGALVAVTTLVLAPACADKEFTGNGSTTHSERRGWAVPRSLPGSEAFDAATRSALTRALLAQPDDYEPRTHHLKPDRGPRYTNRLISQSSPYLLQHAHNPVSWYPWGREAFEEARRLGRPVFLSVGYSTCHWCHVMERESFEDEEIAAILNSRFVPIKVDREERPDVDAVYMAAVRRLSGGGGWPMTVVMTPDGEPFFGGTYFPARAGDRGNRAGLREILFNLANRYETNRDETVAQAKQITAQMRASAQPLPPTDVPTASAIEVAARQIQGRYDADWGGFGGAPKFPRTSNVEFLLRHHRRSDEDASLEAATGTLDRMAAGGIRDHVGGGFHRYSTDRRWLVPHFEKMLYDNALIATAYLEAYQATGAQKYAAVAREILDYVAREMTSEGGAFYSATDADSEVPGGHREEGWFFTWTPEEIEDVVGAEPAELIRQRYGTTARGNFEGRNIFHAAQSIESVAARSGIPEEQARSRLRTALAALYDTRAQRPPPLRDDKVVTGWNGLMISAFARGGRVLRDDELTRLAATAADFLLDNLFTNDALKRSWRAGSASEDAVLDDYAYFIEALLELFEATGSPRWLDAAMTLQATLDAKFADSAGGYFFTASDAEALLTRDKPTYDGARPAGNSVAIRNLLRLAALTDDGSYRTRAERSLGAFGTTLGRAGAGSPRMLAALDFYLDVPKEIILVAPEEDPGVGPGRLSALAPFLDVLSTSFQPNSILVMTTEDPTTDLERLVPLVRGKKARSRRATAYLCEKRVCELPTADPEVFRKQLAKTHPYP